MSYFESTAKYKLIYIFSINDEAHKGLLKVGEATISTTLDLGVLVPNCNPLNQAAKDRIKGYTATASISYKLEHTELALREVKYGGGTVLTGFSDKDVHAVLSNSGKRQIKPNGTSGNEWFEVDLATAKNAIKAVKEGRKFLSSAEKVVKSSPISFREEQEDAITKTLECFKKQNEMLWYAKMRFGKTLTSLEVVRRAEFRRVIIVTHRPVVGSGWREEFNLIFRAGEDKHNYTFLVKDTSGASYDYDEKIDQSNELNLRNYDKNGNYFVYFASIQDLRGSKRVGGAFNKNNAVFDMDWDLIIIDEAHEGTQTFLGDNVIKAIRKDKTKVLALSGTPFNILDQYDENAVYTWDYVMEQKRKAEWDTLHPGDHNPYADLPKMHIYTYELGDNIPGYIEHELEGKAFNFREFFRTWTGDKDYDKTEMPYGVSVGDFRHKEDVQSFLNLITTPNSESLYPYSTKEYRNMFKHTLWMVPGVKEAKALSKMLREHPVFCHFGIANVAGEGDEYEESHYDDALELVRKTIKENDYSITLSCGKLTTGVTVKEWTAVFMLAGSYSTAAAGYMQTIFRVQSAGQIDGKQKTDCYVFDFAPDRTLKVLAETANISRKSGKAGKRQGENRDVMSDFLNFCPVIAIQGTEMKPYSVNTMMEQLKRVYAEKAIKNGFDDASIYNDNLMRLDDLELEKFKTLKGIVGASKAASPLNDVEINAQGFSEEEYERAEKAAKKPKKERTPEELELLKQREEQRKNRNNAISILRGVSIRMPLLIYGANVALTEDISVERFVTMVDDTSWEEFMPNGVTKDIFADFLKYYDRDVFISAGKEIRKLAASADVLTPTERVMAVVKIFDYFKNPDKETVLTPWRVVNMHMSDCLGGWCFYDEKFEKKLDEPRFVDRGQVTKDTFANPNAQILEINSKSGLYPLYVAYSIYRAKLGEKNESDYSVEELNNIWNSVVRDNVFVICKTPMAKSITTRTLLGYTDGKINAHHFEDLINQLKNKPEQFRAKVSRGKYWGKEVQEMKFDAIVGNPPYQENVGDSNSNRALAKQLFPFFMMNAFDLDAEYVSMITPSRWFTGEGQDKSFPKLRQYVRENNHFQYIFNHSGKNLFENVSVGSINYFLYNRSYIGLVEFVEQFNDKIQRVKRPLFEEGLEEILPMNIMANCIRKIMSVSAFSSLQSIATERNPFKVPDVQERLDAIVVSEKTNCHSIKIRCALEKIMYIAPESIRENHNLISRWKVFTSKMNGGAGTLMDGKPVSILGKAYVGEPNSVCSGALIALGSFDSEIEAKHLCTYMSTKFLRFIVGFMKSSQALYQNVYHFVPLQDFTEQSDIDWGKTIDEIDSQLYVKYNLSEDEIAFIEATIKPME